MPDVFNVLDTPAGGGLSAIASHHLLANITAGSAVPSDNTLSDLLDAVFAATRGLVLYRGAAGWAALGTGTAGYLLQTGGVGADPSWIVAPSGTVPSIADGDLLANHSGGAATPIATSVSDLIDYVLGNARGDVLYRGAAGWAALAPGGAGQFFQTAGAGADPLWATPAGAGGALEFVSSQTGVSGASSVDFTGLASGYDYLITGEEIASSVSAVPFVRFGTGAGPTWDAGANYSWGTLSAFEGSHAFSNVNQFQMVNTPASLTGHSMILWLLGGVENVTFHSISGFFSQGATAFGGPHTVNTAITAVRLMMNSGTISGNFYLYRKHKS